MSEKKSIPFLLNCIFYFSSGIDKTVNALYFNNSVAPQLSETNFE